jgi:two-component system, NarL family, response regulator LiaR
MTGNTIHVILADDHHILREGLRALLKHDPEIKVVAEVSTGHEAVKMTTKLEPDVIIMDIGMPDLNGIDATRKIVSSPCKTKVLCLSMHGESAMVHAMMEAGASGYLLKTTVGKELIEAVRVVVANQTYLSPSIARVIVDHHVHGRDRQKDNAFDQLTLREREVLQLIAEGHNTKNIADRLHISPKTVLSHRDRLMKKLGVDSTVALTRYALRQGMTEL